MKFVRFDYAVFLLFAVYALCSLIIPLVLVEVGRDLDFDLTAGGMSAGGILQLGRSLPMVGSMLVCSMLGNRFGLRKSLAVAAVLMSCGICLAAVSQWYWMLLMVLVIAGLGEGLIEGLATPFVGELHRDNEAGRYINFSHGFWSVGIFLGVPLAAILLDYQVSWRILCLMVAAGTLIPFFMLIKADKKNRYPQLEGSGRADAAGALRKALDILKNRTFWLFFAAMFVAGGGEFGMTFWIASLLRLEYNASPFIGGAATAVFSAGMVLGRTGTGIFFRQHQLPLVVIGFALSGTVLSCCFSQVNSIAGVMVLLFLVGLASAPFWPSVQSYCVDRLSQLDSTTLFILLSCAGVPGSGAFSFIMGKLGDMWGLRTAFFVVPICYFLLALLVFWDYVIAGGRKRMSSLSGNGSV